MNVNIPNFLTVFRIVLVPIIVIFLIQGQFAKALICFVIAGVTDALDGMLARLLNQTTVVGAYLDPLADKVLVVSLYATLAIIGSIPGWLAVIVISRDFIILGGILVLTLMSVKLDIKPSFISKINTMVQIATVFFALLLKLGTEKHLREVFLAICWLTAVLSVISGGDYLIKGLKLINRGDGDRGKA